MTRPVGDFQPSGPGRHEPAEPESASGPAPPGEAAAESVALRLGADDRARCWWAGSATEYVEYHDVEWGSALHGDDALFERLCLEAFQSGLSWLTILRKRPAFRLAFAGFAIDTVADFDDNDVQRLLSDAAIVRNRAKIIAAIHNAKVAAALDPGLDELLWSFRPTRPRSRPVNLTDLPASTAESTAMAKELKRRGFKFVGPTTAYALMQATGMVDDHLVGCWRAAAD
jgi:DNA-3-methyladenine glycosylase I